TVCIKVITSVFGDVNSILIIVIAFVNYDNLYKTKYTGWNVCWYSLFAMSKIDWLSLFTCFIFTI
ncbi:MAG TPA: hypothetical protein VK705_01435, partial [Ferruginibacter sp.]|nr:hypothetical protein [Ferruginibacter sp.]